MQALFVWIVPVTLICSIIATVLLTELIKDVWIFDKMPNYIVSYLSAFIILIIASAVFGVINWDNIMLMAVDSIIISVASNGIYNILRH